MQHAEAHERLSDLALEPARLARLETDPSAEAAELREHVAACGRCAADLASWRRTWQEAGRALKGDEPLETILAPAFLRSRTLAAVAAARAVDAAAQPRSRDLATPGRSRRLRATPSLPWLVAAAAVIVAVMGASFGWARQAEVQQLRAETAELEMVAATFDRVLAAPRRWTVALRAADGTPGGTLAWSAREIVVVTTGLPAPGTGQTYRCWVEEAGIRTPMGPMSFSGSTGYWAGSMAAWSGASWANAVVPGIRFGVSLVRDGEQGTPVLIGTL